MNKDQRYVQINGERFLADREFIPLLKALNKVGLKTTQHCSGHGEDEPYLSLDLSNITIAAVKQIDNTPRLMIRWKR